MSESTLVGCHICKGRKKLVGLGSFEIDCHECNGIGWLEIPSKSDEDKFLQEETNATTKISEIGSETIDLPTIINSRNEDDVIEKKKAGRPKKNLEV
jgi:hypothetical protein